jgi:hypothetical protein
MLTPSQIPLYHPGCFFVKSFGCVSSKRSVDPSNKPSTYISYKEQTKTSMVTKKWTYKVGHSRFPNNANGAFLLKNRDISKKFYLQEQNACCYSLKSLLIYSFLNCHSFALTNEQ